MTGAEIILKTAAQAGVEICFANPGTTELSLVAALDSPHRIRPVLGLFEGVCTGAADGYGRIREKPAMTLLHLGPGLANGIANLHNARRARTPVLNVVGEHTTWIQPHDPPLNMDISMLAQTVPGWQKKSMAAGELSADTAEAVCASLYGQVSTLIVPADIQSASVGTVEIINKPFSFNPVDEEMIPHAVSMIKEASRPALILGGRTLRRKGLQAAAQIKAKSGCELIMMTFPSLFEAGASLPVLKRVPYFPGEAQKLLKHYDAFILVGTNEPTAFFGYAEGIISFLPPNAANGKPPPSTLPNVAISGLIPKCSCAPPNASLKPVTISSKIKIAPFSVVILRRLDRNSFTGRIKPTLARTGSSITAAMSLPSLLKTVSRAPTSL